MSSLSCSSLLLFLFTTGRCIKGVITCRVPTSTFFIKKVDSVRGLDFLQAHSFDFQNFWCFEKLNVSSARWCIQIRYLSATIKTPLQQSIIAGPRVPSGGRNRIFQIIDSYGVRLCIACESSPNRFRTYLEHFRSIPSVFSCLNRWFPYLHQILMNPGCDYPFNSTNPVPGYKTSLLVDWTELLLPYLPLPPVRTQRAQIVRHVARLLLLSQRC